MLYCASFRTLASTTDISAISDATRYTAWTLCIECVQVYRCLHSTAPGYLSALYQPTSSVPGRRHRQLDFPRFIRWPNIRVRRFVNFKLASILSFLPTFGTVHSLCLCSNCGVMAVEVQWVTDRVDAWRSVRRRELITCIGVWRFVCSDDVCVQRACGRVWIVR